MSLFKFACFRNFCIKCYATILSIKKILLNIHTVPSGGINMYWNFDSVKVGFYVPFNSQGHIGTRPQHCHLWGTQIHEFYFMILSILSPTWTSYVGSACLEKQYHPPFTSPVRAYIEVITCELVREVFQTF